MLKSWLINILIVLALVGAYYTDLFGLMASAGAFWIGLFLVGGVLIAAFVILGNPWAKNNESDKSE